MNDNIGRSFRLASFVASKVVVRCQGVEDLARLCKIGLECEDASIWIRKVNKVEVQNLALVSVLSWLRLSRVIAYMMASFNELWNNMTASFPTAACEYDSFRCGSH